MRLVALTILSTSFLFANAITSIAATEMVLHNFTGPVGNEGSYPIGDLVRDTFGNLYGTTRYGGANGAGVVFEIMNGNGSWSEKTIYAFTGGRDGDWPMSGVILDPNGNLYGTTYGGGASGAGTVFMLASNGKGDWKETVLYSFAGGTDGANPLAGLEFDQSGDLYGTTYYGGANGVGTVFRLSLASGISTETVLHSFGWAGKDGAFPDSALLIDKAGDLFGTTQYGGSGNCAHGASGCGVVFSITHSRDFRRWTEKILHRFSGRDGSSPMTRLAMGPYGYMYGTTNYGGIYDLGVAFAIKHTPKGWVETVLHDFGGPGDGAFVRAGLTIDAAKNLYGTTQGNASGNGTVYRLKYANGHWTETVLYSFGNYPDGSQPLGGVIVDSTGNLYGTTDLGGSANEGTVFEIAP
jgi:uncharacterized repeat protein (TIGR03803 family)